MGVFDLFGDAVKAVVHGVEEAADWVGDRVNDAEHWFDDLAHGNLGTQAMSVPELVKNVMASQGATDWHGGASQAIRLAGDHRVVASQIQKISSGLESVWTGSGAEAAQAKLKPLSEVADSAAQTFNANSTHVTGLASGFDEMKRSLTSPPLPSSPSHKDFLDVVTPWDTDTEDKINQYNVQIQEKLNRYNSYAQQAQDAGRQLNIDYGQIGTFDGDVALAADTKSSTKSHPTSGTSNTAHTFSGLDVPPAAVPQTSGSTAAATANSGDGFSSGRSPESLTSDGTTSSAYLPSGQTPTGYGTTSFGTPGGSGPSPTPDGLAALGGLGAAGGLGGKVGGGAGEGGQPGAGNRTGVGPGRGPGAGTAAERVATTGRGTTSGLGAAGTGAGRGKSGEDEEHNRKYGVEDDSLFVDHGERLVDPETGMHVTPPTIGG